MLTPVPSMPAAYNGFKSYWTAKSAGARASSGGEFPIVHSGWTTWVLRSYKALPRTLTCGVGRKSWSGVIPAITGEGGGNLRVAVVGRVCLAVDDVGVNFC